MSAHSMPCGVERFERVRRDRLYVEMDRSAPVIGKSWLAIAGEFGVGVVLGLAILALVLP